MTLRLKLRLQQKEPQENKSYFSLGILFKENA